MQKREKVCICQLSRLLACTVCVQLPLSPPIFLKAEGRGLATPCDQLSLATIYAKYQNFCPVKLAVGTADYDYHSYCAAAVISCHFGG